MRALEKRETPVVVLPTKGARVGFSLNLEANIIAPPASSKQAHTHFRRRKSERQRLDEQWRGLLRQLRHLLCRAVKGYALHGTPAALAEVNTALAVLLAEERSAAKRRRYRRRGTR